MQWWYWLGILLGPSGRRNRCWAGIRQCPINWQSPISTKINRIISSFCKRNQSYNSCQLCDDIIGDFSPLGYRRMEQWVAGDFSCGRQWLWEPERTSGWLCRSSRDWFPWRCKTWASLASDPRSSTKVDWCRIKCSADWLGRHTCQFDQTLTMCVKKRRLNIKLLGKLLWIIYEKSQNEGSSSGLSVVWFRP